MTTVQKILLILVVVICIFMIGLGLSIHQDMFVVLGALVLAMLVVGGIVIGLKKLFGILWEKYPRLIIGAAAVAYLALVVLIFVEPAVPFFLGFLLVFAPVVLSLLAIRTHENVGSGGCTIMLVLAIAGGVLLLLVWLIRPTEFSQFLSGVLS